MDTSEEIMCPDCRQLYKIKSSRSGCSGDTADNLPPLTVHNVHGKGNAVSRNNSVSRRNRMWGSSVAYSAWPVRVGEKDDNDLLLASTDVKTLVMSAANAAEPEAQLTAVQRCCILLASAPAPPSDELVSRGVLPALVQCLSRADSPSLQHYAASALASAATGPAQTERVVQAGAVPQLLHLLTSPHQLLCEQAVRALGNILGDGTTLRSAKLELDVVQALLRVIKPEIPSSLLHRALCLISNVCRSRPLPANTTQDILLAFNVVIGHTDPTVLCETVRAVNFLLTCGDREQTQLVIDSCIAAQLVRLLSHKEVAVQTAALEALRNITGGTLEHRQPVLDCGALSRLPALLSHQTVEIRKLALGILVNIIYYDHHAVQLVIDAGLLPKIVWNLGMGPLETQHEAVRVVYNLAACGTIEQKAALIQCGVLPRLCSLLDCEDTDVASKKEIRVHALGALANMCWGHHAVQPVIDAGLLPKIVENLSKGSLETQLQAVRAVCNLASCGTEEQVAVLAQCGVLPPLFRLFDCEDPDVASKEKIRLHTLGALANIVYIGHHEVQRVIDAGLLPKIVENLSKGPLETQLRAIGAVLNLTACGTKEQKVALIECGVLPPLCSLLDCEDADAASKEKIRNDALGALANLIYRDHNAVQAVIDVGLLPNIVGNLSMGPLETQSEAVRTVYNLAVCGTTEQKAALAQCGAFPALCSLLDCEDPDVASKEKIRIHALGALANIVCCGHHEVVIDAGLLPKIVENLSKGLLETQLEAVRAVLNLTARGTEEHVATLIQCGVLPALCSLLDCEDLDVASKEKLRNDVLGALANIMYRDHNAVQPVIDVGLLPKIVENLSKGPLVTQSEAVRAVKNLTAGGTEEQKAALIQCGGLPPLCRLLDCEDPNVAYRVLLCLGNLLHKTGPGPGPAEEVAALIQQCGGVERIKWLQEHEELEIRKQAREIIDQYFSGEESSDASSISPSPSCITTPSRGIGIFM